MFKLLLGAFTLAFKTVSAPDGFASGGFTDLNPATVTGLAAGTLTLGGAAFVGAAFLPGQVLGGAALATTCLGLGEVKNRTGSYLPFLGKDTAEPAPAVDAATETA